MNWREQALKSLDDARAEIIEATEPTIIVVLTIGSDDLLKERPVSVYANQNWRWLQRMMAFAAWRFSLKEDEDTPA
jgi:hypothetical protein